MSRLCVIIVDGNKNIPNLKRDWDGQHHKIYGWKPKCYFLEKNFLKTFIFGLSLFTGSSITWGLTAGGSWGSGEAGGGTDGWLWRLCGSAVHNQANYWHRSHLSAVQCFVKNYSNTWITNPNDWQNEKKEFALIKSSATPRLHFHLKPGICVH